MSIKPILFSTEMVRGLLSGTKTVTRRVVRPRYCDSVFEMFGGELCETSPYKPPIDNGDGTTTRFVRHCVPCKPPYRPGDTLYVRETWQHGFGGTYLYKADAGYDPFMTADGELVSDIPWHRSIHMPREAARIFLRVTAVRVERLQDITEEQAKVEGAIDNRPFIHSYSNEYETLHSAREHFAAIWDNTIKKAGRALYGWDANPWVWVIEFERCEKPKE